MGDNNKPGSGCVGCEVHEGLFVSAVSGWLKWRMRAWERAGLVDGFENWTKGGDQSCGEWMRPSRESEQRKPHHQGPGGGGVRKNSGGGTWEIRGVGGQIQGRGDI